MEHLEPYSNTVNTGMPIIEALKRVNTPPAYTAFIVDSESRLMGVLTDGDFRRGLLAGHNLDNSVDVFMNRNPTTALENISEEDAKSLLRKKFLRCLPLLSQDGKLKIILTPNLLEQEIKTGKTAVIMAGGKGSRLYPLTKGCPKPMLSINRKPILEILIEQCIEAGFENLYISVNYLKEQIIEHFDDGRRWGVSINYLVEDKPLGTAGSLQLLPDTLSEPFLVINGDVLTRLNPRHLMNFHIDNQAQATLCVREHEITVPFGVVHTKSSELASFEEKPTYRHLVNAGVYVIDPQLLSLLPPDEFTDMPNFLMLAQEYGHRVAVCPIHEYWLDVGRPEELNTAQTTW